MLDIGADRLGEDRRRRDDPDLLAVEWRRTRRRDTDRLHRFVFEHTDVRGELVRLDASWRAVLERQQYPAPVRQLLGEALAAVTLLSATIKFDGFLHLQLRGDGPLELVLVEVTAQRTVRGLARWSGAVPAAPLAAQVGKAWLTLTIDPGAGRERYQGLVAVEQELQDIESLEVPARVVHLPLSTLLSGERSCELPPRHVFEPVK